MNNREECPMRHTNGNCLAIGGFCTSVNDEICNGLRNAYSCGNGKLIEESRSVKMVIQGWQCPICKRVYNPYTEKCLHCGPEQESNVVLNVTDTSNFDNQYAGTVRRKLGGNWEESEYGRRTID